MVPIPDTEYQQSKITGETDAEVDGHLDAGRLLAVEYGWDGQTVESFEWVDASGTEIVVAGHGFWGKSDSLVGAKARFRAYGGRLADGYIVLTFGPGSHFMGVNAMGYRWLGSPPEVREVAERGVRTA